jgi:hypothetical protein
MHHKNAWKMGSSQVCPIASMRALTFVLNRGECHNLKMGAWPTVIGTTKCLYWGEGSWMFPSGNGWPTLRRFLTKKITKIGYLFDFFSLKKPKMIGVKKPPCHLKQVDLDLMLRLRWSFWLVDNGQFDCLNFYLNFNHFLGFFLG